MTSEVDNGVTTNYSYDANGNTTETSNGTTTTTFTYDSQNRMVKQDAGTASEIDIMYDGAGNKVSETVNGVTSKYLIDGNNPTGYSQIVEEIVNGAVARRYTLGHWIISETQNISGTWATSFYGYDGHNSVRFLTNAAGAVTDNYTFDAFGIEIAHSGSTPNQVLYAGEYLDPGTGNYDLRARVYNENTGTFLTRDTYAGQNGDPITLHQYLYAGSDPVMNVDPSGNEFSLPDIITSVGIYMQNVGMRISTAFAAGDTAVGVLWNELGQEAENFAQEVLTGVLPDNAVISENAKALTSRIDFKIVLNEAKVAWLEVKYSLPQDGAAFSRAINQLTNVAATAGENDRIVMWALRSPTLAQQTTFLEGLPENVASRVTIISGVSELATWLKIFSL